MKLVLLACVLATFVAIECNHTFLGTNVGRPLIYHHNAEYGSKMFRKRIENLYFKMPNLPSFTGKTIQGILAYDLANSSASANITQGGLGYNFVNIRMKSERAKAIHYDVYIYA